MHPELFELKALVAGRLDAHRRREIDDHLGSCADCSRQYVALMLGSSSPKTAEAEARAGLVPQGAGTVITLGGSGQATVEMYGIDAPLGPSAGKSPARKSNGSGVTLETEFPAASARTQVPVSSSLVDAIAKLRAESEAQKAALAAPVPVVLSPTPTRSREFLAPVAESALIEPSIFMPTPADGISIIRSGLTPASSRLAAELPAFMTRPSPSASVAAQPELVVTFTSTPPRVPSYRSPSSVTIVTPSADREWVSQAVPNLATSPRTDFHVSETTVAGKPRSMKMGLMMGGAALAAVLALSGYQYFQSSVSKAASAAASAAATRVQAEAASARAAAPVATVPAAPPQVQTRIVYVREPAKKGSESRAAETASTTSAVAPLSIALPEVNVSTGSAEAAIQANTQRSATSELTRSARATSSRTAAPRPF